MQQTVSFGRYALSVEVTGADETPVVLVHSTGMSARQWRGLATRLEPDHRVLLPDLLGYGASTAIARGEPLHWHLDVLGLEALLDTLDRPAHLVGHSYGALLAMTAALRRPRAVRSLSLVEPVAFAVLRGTPDDTFGASQSSMPFGDGALPDDRAADEAWLTWFVDYWNGPGAFARLPERMRASFVSNVWVCFREVWSLMGDATPAEVWSTIAAPTLFIRGERSPREARAVCERLAHALPDAALTEIEGAGHMAPITHESEVSARIAAWLAAH